MATWKPVVGHESTHEVSDAGAVRNKATGCIVKAYICGRYLMVQIGGKRRYVHRCVLHAFRGPPPTTKHVSNHLNFDRADNRLENLEWCTQAENILHSRNSGRWPKPRSRRRNIEYVCNAAVRMASRAEKFAAHDPELAQAIKDFREANFASPKSTNRMTPS